jgi:hypothetical protein
MARGDHIYVWRYPLPYTHHGIDLGDGSVIHYSGEPLAKYDAEVKQSSMDEFLNGGAVVVRRYGQRDDAEATVARAFSQLGKREYNLIVNNCEHFAEWCCTGTKISEQVRAKVAAVAHTTVGGAAFAGTTGVIAGLGVVEGVSGAGIMAGLASAGGLVGAGAAMGPAVLAVGPAVAAVGITMKALGDDERLPNEQRAARANGRLAAPAAAVGAAAGGFAAISSAGAVSGLSAAGISSGLAAIGATAGGGMVAGASVLVAAPAVAAAAVGFGVYKVSRHVRERRAARRLDESPAE